MDTMLNDMWKMLGSMALVFLALAFKTKFIYNRAFVEKTEM